MTAEQARTVLVTGGASGIGAACVASLAARGDQVFCVDREIPERTVAGVEYRRGDVTDEAGVRELIDGIGTLHGLVTCAGITHREPALSLAMSDFQRVLDVNLRGTFLCARTAAEAMTEGGSIVTIASMLSHYGTPNLAAYSAAKGGVLALTRVLAVEWASAGIRVNSISPGYVRTEFMAGVLERNPEYAEQIRARTPGGRLAEPEEVAETAAWLLGTGSGFVTGQDIAVDGGILAGDRRLAGVAKGGV
ncbi:SDR family NAD(P)-dependent oxidoreductase [Sciscionella sediminilitoris]|uniref:SDR family NAD(P)-dependent oxidoreductase n=1 Tax=Sciscionella sediminilitoris TaxID=1445613 RepID=UPI00056048EA|nr:SDR family oxidoreductase [Sciscionella sp. SE31]